MAIWVGNPRLEWDQTLTHCDWIQVAPDIVGPDQAAALTVRVYMDVRVRVRVGVRVRFRVRVRVRVRVR